MSESLIKIVEAIGLLSTLSLYGSRKQIRTQTNANSNRLFFSFYGNGKGTATPPLNCNINSVVGEINPQRPRVEDCRTSIKLVGNADVRANFLNHHLHYRAWEKFLGGAQ